MPKFGTIKTINDILIIRSIILITITLVWASSPFKILSTMMSIYINGIKKDMIFMYEPTWGLLYIIIPKSLPNTKNINIKIIENRKVMSSNFFVYFLIFL